MISSQSIRIMKVPQRCVNTLGLGRHLLGGIDVAKGNPRICRFEGCTRSVGHKGGKGWCPTHYMQAWRWGSPSITSAEVRFGKHWKRIASGCWEWQSSISTHGYGQFHLHGKKLAAHRFCYELLVGPIPDGLEIDHLCRNRKCVNPAHLEPVTHAENVRRGTSGHNWRAKTHCPKGHPYDDVNTRLYRGRRYCNTCLAECGRRANAKRKAERAKRLVVLEGTRNAA